VDSKYNHLKTIWHTGSCKRCKETVLQCDMFIAFACYYRFTIKKNITAIF